MKVTSYHRKHAVKEALIVLWEASDRICSKRLKALLPLLVEAMELHGHLQLQSWLPSRDSNPDMLLQRQLS